MLLHTYPYYNINSTHSPILFLLIIELHLCEYSHSPTISPERSFLIDHPKLPYERNFSRYMHLIFCSLHGCTLLFTAPYCSDMAALSQANLSCLDFASCMSLQTLQKNTTYHYRYHPLRSGVLHILHSSNTSPTYKRWSKISLSYTSTGSLKKQNILPCDHHSGGQ